MTWFLEGGFSMLFVLVFGGIALASATRFALHPSVGGARPIFAYGLAVACASVAGVGVNLSTVSHSVAAHPEWVEESGLGLVVVVGAGESVAPLAFGFAVCAVTALVTAIGLRRAPEA